MKIYGLVLAALTAFAHAGSLENAPFVAPTNETLNKTDFLLFASRMNNTDLAPYFAEFTDEASVSAAVSKHENDCDFSCRCQLACTFWLLIPPMWAYCMWACVKDNPN